MAALAGMPELDAALSSLRVVEIDPSRDQRWEAFLAGRPDATVYHHPLWLQLLHEAFNYQPAHLMCEDTRGQVRGILPLFGLRGILTGRRFSSLPRTPVGGPLAVDRKATAALLATAVERAQAERNGHLQLKVESDTIDGLVDGLVGGPFRPTYVLPLPSADQPMLFGNARHRHRLKGNVTKAARHGILVREAESLAEMRAWHRLYLETMRWRFVPPRPYRFFEIAWDLLRPRDLLRLLLAEQRGEAGPRLLSGGGLPAV